MSVNYAANAVVRLSIFFQQGAQVAQMDRNISGLNPIPGVLWNSANLFAQMVADSFPGLLLPICSPTVAVLGVKLYLQNPGGPPLDDQDVIDFAATCTGAANDMPAQNAGLIQFHSSVGGSRGRGRMYAPFPNQAAQTGTGALAAGYETALTNIASQMIGGWSIPNVGVGGGTVTVKACTKYTVGAPAVAFPMDALTIASGFATQKRRGFFGKPNNSPF